MAGKVLQAAGTPHSYIVETPSGEIRRNRAHLRVRTDPQPPVDAPTSTTEREPSQLLTQNQSPVHKLEQLFASPTIYDIE